MLSDIISYDTPFIRNHFEVIHKCGDDDMICATNCSLSLFDVISYDDTADSPIDARVVGTDTHLPT